MGDVGLILWSATLVLCCVVLQLQLDLNKKEVCWMCFTCFKHTTNTSATGISKQHG